MLKCWKLLEFIVGSFVHFCTLLGLSQKSEKLVYPKNRKNLIRSFKYNHKHYKGYWLLIDEILTIIDRKTVRSLIFIDKLLTRSKRSTCKHNQRIYRYGGQLTGVTTGTPVRW